MRRSVPDASWFKKDVMHELSIAQAIVDSAREHAALHGGRRVLRIGVRVGATSGVAVDALEFCFGMTITGTDIDGASLDLQPVPVRYRCQVCNREFEPLDLDAPCDQCGSGAVSMIGGDDLALSYLELE